MQPKLRSKSPSKQEAVRLKRHRRPDLLARVEAHLLPFPNVHLGATCEPAGISAPQKSRRTSELSSLLPLVLLRVSSWSFLLPLSALNAISCPKILALRKKQAEKGRSEPEP